VSIVTALLAPFADGHIRLIEPKSWVVENELGNRQKPGRCGGTEGDPGVSQTGAITRVQGGPKLHIQLREVVFHPGHYRIALAVNSRAELPKDPGVVARDADKGPQSVSAMIDPPTVPVLADGLWQHASKSAAPFETDVQLPNNQLPDMHVANRGIYGGTRVQQRSRLLLSSLRRSEYHSGSIQAGRQPFAPDYAKAPGISTPASDEPRSDKLSPTRKYELKTNLRAREQL
jgi:hypothetical protein